MNFLKLLFLVFTAAFAFACAATAPNNSSVSKTAEPPAAPSNNASALPAEIADGAKLYKDNCAACHKEDGSGGKMVVEGRKINPDNLATAKMKGFSDEKLARNINEGVEDEGMPAFKDKLKEAEVAAIIKHIRTDLQKQ
jgi:mono/diheme cytochrome c family protein